MATLVRLTYTSIDTFVHWPRRHMSIMMVMPGASVLLLNGRCSWLESLEINSIRVH